jgi:hypothetical protein
VFARFTTCTGTGGALGPFAVSLEPPDFEGIVAGDTVSFDGVSSVTSSVISLSLSSAVSFLRSEQRHLGAHIVLVLGQLIAEVDKLARHHIPDRHDHREAEHGRDDYRANAAKVPAFKSPRDRRKQECDERCEDQRQKEIFPEIENGDDRGGRQATKSNGEVREMDRRSLIAPESERRRTSASDVKQLGS